MSIISFNAKECFIHHDIQTVIDLVNSLKQDHDFNDDRESLAKMINAKSYLQDKRSLEAVLKGTNASMEDVLQAINQAIDKSLTKNFEIIYEKNPEWIEIALWREIAKNKIYLKQVSKENLLKAIETKKIRLETILREPELVSHFKNLLENYLLENNNALIETLLRKYEFKTSSAKIHLPLSLDINDSKDQKWIEERIQAYIENIDHKDQRALVYLDKLFFAKKIPISEKTRSLVAEKRKEILKDRQFQQSPMHYGIRFDGIEEESLIDRENREIVFNIQRFKHYDDFKIRFFHNLGQVFELLPHGSFASHDRDIDFSFLDFISFKRVGEERKMAPYNKVLALMLYQRFLNDHHSSLENLLEEFYNDYLKTEFAIDDFNFHLSFDEDYRVKKIQNILDILEKSIEKMATHLNEEKAFESFDQIQSQAEIKHLYPKDKNYGFYRLNSDRYSLPIKHGFLNLYDAVISNELIYEQIDPKSKEKIDALLEENVLDLDKGRVVFTDPKRAKLYRRLYHYGVLLYPELPQEEQRLMKEDLQAAYLDYDRKLFSIQERDLLAFFLDHGFKLRRNYQKLDDAEREESVDQSDYFMILMLLIQVSLKFHNELLIQN